MKIPWKNIYNEPCIAEIDGFYLLAVPNQHMKYNEEQEKKYAKEMKHAELEKVENAKLKELEKGITKNLFTWNVLEKLDYITTSGLHFGQTIKT